MKITEIDFSKDGKEYDVTFDGKSRRVTTRHGDLIFVDGKYDVTDDYRLCAVLNADYTEVIEPVDFMTAYMDCKENGQRYTRASQGDLAVSADIFRDECGVVSLYFAEDINSFFPDKTLWIKVD